MKSLLKTLTVNKGAILIPHIDAYQAAGKFPPKWTIEIINEKPDDGHYHPSTDAVSPIPALWEHRRRQLKKMLHPQPISTSLRRVFDAGHMWHCYYGNILVEMGLVRPDHVELYTTHEIETEYGKTVGAGTGDLVGVEIPGHGSWLVDMKTQRKDEFEMGPLPATYQKWSYQVQCYADWFGYDQIMILAIQKDSPHDLREYIIPKDLSIVQSIYNKWTYIDACLEQDKEPDVITFA